MLSENQKEAFWRDGFVVIPKVFSDEALQPMRSVIQQWVDESRQYDGPFGEIADGRPRFDVQPGHSASQPALRRVQSPEEVSDVFWDVVTKGPLIESVSELIGPNVRFHHAKLNSKLPGSATEVKWHQDFTFDPHSNDDGITAMLFIDPVNQSTGSLSLVPESHRGPLKSLWQDGVFTGSVSAADAKDADQKAVQCGGPAGSLCLMHTRCLHASGPNISKNPRTLYIGTLVSADAIRLSPVAVPSSYSGKLVSGKEPGTIRSISFDMELPEIPKEASFFDQQAKQKNN